MGSRKKKVRILKPNEFNDFSFKPDETTLDGSSLKKNQFACVNCNKQFTQKTTLELHMLIHKEDKSFSCNICASNFPFLSRLQKHYLLKHPNDLHLMGTEKKAGTETPVIGQEDEHLEMIGQENELCQTDDRVIGQEGEQWTAENLLIGHQWERKNQMIGQEDGQWETEDEHQVLQSLTSAKKLRQVSKTSSDNNKVTCDLNMQSGFEQELVITDDGIHIKKELDENEWLEEANQVVAMSNMVLQGSEGMVITSDIYNACEGTESVEQRKVPQHIPNKSKTYEKQYECKKCNRKFVWKISLVKHNQAFHGPRERKSKGEKMYECGTCNQKFVREYNFQTHVKTRHKQKKNETETTLKCKFCRRKFTQKGSLTRHIRSFHDTETANDEESENELLSNDEEERKLPPLEDGGSSNDSWAPMPALNIGPYLCEVCNEGFLKNEDFQTHLLTHTGKSFYSCKICGKTFGRKTNYEAHFARHSNKKWSQCHICGKGFETQKDRNAHQRLHSENGELRCTLCNRMFDRFSNYKNHLRLHERHKCIDCNKKFGKSIELRRHMRLHWKALKFICGICERRFATNEILRRHLERHEEVCQCPACHKVTRRCARNVEKLKCCHICNEGMRCTTEFRSHLLEHTMETPDETENTEGNVAIMEVQAHYDEPEDED